MSGEENGVMQISEPFVSARSGSEGGAEGVYAVSKRRHARNTRGDRGYRRGVETPREVLAVGPKKRPTKEGAVRRWWEVVEHDDDNDVSPRASSLFS